MLKTDMPGRKGQAIIDSYINTVSRSGTGAHVFVPLSWIGKRVKITVIDDNDTSQQKEKQEEPITTREELKSELKRHTSAAARLVRRSISYSSEPGSKK